MPDPFDMREADPPGDPYCGGCGNYKWDCSCNECMEPCPYPGCQQCNGYWRRMVHEGFWQVGRGWTDKGVREFTK